MASATASQSKLWQIPTFVLGITALAAVWFGRPYLLPSSEQMLERDFSALRQALDRNPVDAGQVQTLLRKVNGIDPPSQLKKDAPYIIGGALVIVAETSTIPEEAAEQWKAARKLLETAEENGVPEDDKLRLRFRLAKSWAHTGEAPRKVIDALNASIKCGDDPADGCRVLAEMYMKIEPHEPKKARDALKEYMAKVLPARTEPQQRQMNQARLMLGELQIQLRETDEARKLLERIGPDSPVETLVAARTLLAKSYLDDEEWKQAIRYLEQARDVRGITPAQRTNVLYQLAGALLRAKRRPEAMAALEQLRKGNGPEALAASFRLVELYSEGEDASKRDECVAILEAVSTELNVVGRYDNNLLPIGEARDIFEEVARKLREAKEFDLSRRTARAYAPIAEAGRDHELTAQALQEWGLLLLDRTIIAEPEERPRLAEEGTKRLREAAQEWSDVAAFKKTTLAKGEPLFRAADLYYKAGDPDAALKAFDTLNLTVPDLPSERLVEVWLKKGEVYLALNNREQARLCFQNGVKIGGPHPTIALVKCQVRLAEILAKLDDSSGLTRQIAELESTLADPALPKDFELTRTTLLFIAEVYFQQKAYTKAEVKLRSLRDTYPDSPQALNARFMLGQCYWFIAGQEAEKCKAAKKVKEDPLASQSRVIEAEAQYDASYKLYMDWLRKAAEPFNEVEAILLKADVKHSPADAELLRKTSFYAADVQFFSGNYQEAVKRFDGIAQRYAGTIAQLEALKMIWKCWQYYLQDAQKAQDTLIQLKTAFDQMPKTEFDGSSDIRRRDYWIRWFEQVLPMKKSP